MKNRSLWDEASHKYLLSVFLHNLIWNSKRQLKQPAKYGAFLPLQQQTASCMLLAYQTKLHVCSLSAFSRPSVLVQSVQPHFFHAKKHPTLSIISQLKFLCDWRWAVFFLHLPWLTHCRKRGTLYTAQATAHRLLQMATNMTVHGTGLFSLLYLNKHSLNKKRDKRGACTWHQNSGNDFLWFEEMRAIK